MISLSLLSTCLIWTCCRAVGWDPDALQILHVGGWEGGKCQQSCRGLHGHQTGSQTQTEHVQYRRPCTAEEEGHRAECGSAQTEGDYLYQKIEIKISLSLPKRFEFEPVVRSLTGSNSAPIKLEGMVINNFLANDLNAIQFRFIYIAPNLKAVVSRCLNHNHSSADQSWCQTQQTCLVYSTLH